MLARFRLAADNLNLLFSPEKSFFSIHFDVEALIWLPFPTHFISPEKGFLFIPTGNSFFFFFFDSKAIGWQMSKVPLQLFFSSFLSWLVLDWLVKHISQLNFYQQFDCFLPLLIYRSAISHNSGYPWSPSKTMKDTQSLKNKYKKCQYQ